MSEIKLIHLFEVKEQEIVDLMNNNMVKKHMPLLNKGFSAEDCKTFLKSKKEIWDEHGYGPWAFLIDDKFAGWGGLQPENGEADFALVLHPKYWGYGKKIFNKIKNWAFNEIDIETITALFPPGRTNSKAIKHLGFIDDGELTIDGELFLRFRFNRLKA
ncbi:GNAT family N-acetyltransferase [Halobacteriovorax sp. JY17]|uniref:GNAT family N-acetyltransferase n=1 Tax=Halobacteriovorax sp. JY17 TaxID=2014617 RepID=UPI000C65B0D5|nr:GNAT family N-acetyltransferase [Halobacteriovorax sp. JY17]PIK13500.1 MAG: GNAT family N-acetyltransferase [Halobacteriovorax sp. JY17]